MGATRNASPTVVPINALPPELLSRIFALDIRLQYIAASDETTLTAIPHNLMYSERLLRVCSGWRQISTTTRTFWSQIDLAPGHSKNKRLLARAKVYATRAGQLPLQIHIVDGALPRSPSEDAETDNLLEFLASIAPRTCSFVLATTTTFTHLHYSILRVIFENGVPGVLGRLAMMAWGPQPCGFIESASSNPVEDLSLDLPQQLLEDLWLPVTVLCLRNQYPHWTSEAYKGLAELRLTAGVDPAPLITESQLIGILTSSPGVRILKFNISITETLPNSPIVPVPLDGLEELCLSSMTHSRFGDFLRLLAPGLKLTQIPLNLGVF